MTDTNATYYRNIVVDYPDWADADVIFKLDSNYAAAGSEGFPVKEYILTLDANGQGTQKLPTPDGDGTLSWAWTITTPDPNYYDGMTLAYGADLNISDWISAEQSTETPNTLLDTFLLKSGDTATGPIDFSGTDHAGLTVLSLTTTQRDALTPSNGAIIYNTTTGQFEGYDDGWAALAGAGASALDDLTDVTITGTPADNEVLAYDTGTGEWINQTAVEAGLADSGQITTLTGIISTHIGDTSNPHGVTAAQAGALAIASDLGDLNSASTARSNLFGVSFAVTGGGTLALGGFTLTVPATGTAALLATANVFTAVQQITGTDLGTSTIAFDVSITPTANGNHAQARLINNRNGSSNNAAIFTLSSWGQLGSAPRVDFINRYRSYTGSLQGYDDGMRLTAGQMSGTNVSAFDVILMGGQGTGTGAGGSVLFQTAPIGGSGSSVNSPVTAAEIDDQPTGGDETRLLLLDLSDGTLKRVVFGADDSAGTGLKALAVAN